MKDNKLEQMLMSGGKGASSKMAPEDIKAKLDVIVEMIDAMKDAMGGSVKSGLDELLAGKNGMQKVSVMAPDKDSLAAGLGAAQDMLPEGNESDEAEPDVHDVAGIAKEAQAEGEAPEMEKAEAMAASEKPDADEEDDGDTFFGKKRNKSKFY